MLLTNSTIPNVSSPLKHVVYATILQTTSHSVHCTHMEYKTRLQPILSQTSYKQKNNLQLCVLRAQKNNTDLHPN